MSTLKPFDFIEGEVILIDKPLNWTSFDVVNKLRWKIKNFLGVKKIKVGHAGTLDPLATGLLIICTGKKTKSIESFQDLPKIYSGTITLGATRPSFDMETEIDKTFDTSHITEEKIFKIAKEMEGEQEQMPPIFSAKKVEGKTAYNLARAGKEVVLKTKKINIMSFEISQIRNNEVDFLIECSKGTYIRSIAYDFGVKLNSGAYLSALRREKIGDYSIENADNVEVYLERLDSLLHKEG